MVFNKNSETYIKSKQMLDEFVASGRRVEDLGVHDKEYIFIKRLKVCDENGKILTLEEKFEKLNYPRKKRYSSDVKADLIAEIEEYLETGGTFHINRKKFPFYEKLRIYSNQLSRKGINKTNEQIMKDLGYTSYSEDYYRCKHLFELDDYEDKNGYVDSFIKDDKLHAYIKDVSICYGIPYYFTIALLCDKKLKKYVIEVDKIAYTQRLLNNHVNEYGTLVGIKRNNPKVYNAFEYLTKYYSDGEEVKFTKQDWLDIFGLGDVDHKFKNVTSSELDITEAIQNLRKQCPDGVVVAKDVNKQDYSKVVKKALKMGTSVSELLSMYGLKHKHLSSSRMAKTVVEEIPYLKEMKARRDAIISANTKADKKLCKEEKFEIKLKAVVQVYEEYKEKLLSYLPNCELIDDLTENFNV